MHVRLATAPVSRSESGSRRDENAGLETAPIILGDLQLYVVDGDKWQGSSERLAAVRATPLAPEVPADHLYLVSQKGRTFQRDHPEISVLVDKGRYLVVELEPASAARIEGIEEPCYAVRPLAPGTVVFESMGRPAARRAAKPAIQAVVDDLSRQQFLEALSHLVSFHNRHSTSDLYGQAATWVEGQLTQLGYAVRREQIQIPGGTTSNVIADREGSGNDRRMLIAAAHLDSVNAGQGPQASAPGADDNGSGSAGVLALASALAATETNHDLRFILFGGEEQGLHGSRQHVAALPDGERRRIDAVINMDMIGSLNAPTPGQPALPTVLLEGAPVSSKTVEDLADMAATYTGLAVEKSLNPFASDHLPFIRAEVPAVLTIEGADSVNSFIHTSDDTLDRINVDLAMDILRMNAAFLADRLSLEPA